MTLQELRLDIMARGFYLQEKVEKDTVLTVISKLDTDDLRYDWTVTCTKENYTWADGYAASIKNAASEISKLIISRHDQNINTCEHDMITIGSNKCCKKCMGRFGQIIPVQLNFN